MIVLALMAAAAVLLGVGIGTQSGVLDAIAFGLSTVAVMLLLLSWARPDALLYYWTQKRALQKRRAAQVLPALVAEAAIPAVGDLEPATEAPALDVAVVFVPGRTTFHLDSCSLVADKMTSKALRGDLETGGMAACRRCLRADTA